MYSSNYLFNNEDLRSFLENRMGEAIREIKNQDNNYILNVNIQDYLKYFVDEYTLEVPNLIEKNIDAEHNEKEIDVSGDPRRHFGDRNTPFYVTGTEVTFNIPFSGDSVLFTYKPSTFNYNPPEGIVRNQELSLFFEGVDLEADDIKHKLDRELDKVKQWLDWVRKDVEKFNQKFPQEIESQITTRRKKLLKDSNLASELGVPLRERTGIPVTYTVPSKRKTIIPKPSASTTPFKPEPTLSMDDYEHILNVVQNMTMVMERSPKTFKSIGEEDIRQHFLVQLNGHYEGDATGETFNYEGKTDILIRKNGKNLFIAECKIWKGAEVLKETIDQILKYLSWRDTKTAIIIFNRNKDLSNVLSQISDIVSEHPNFKREIDYDSETGFRFIFHHNDDENRELYLTLLVFDVPT